MTTLDFDVLIVGGGLAGLSAAVHLAPTHRVAVLTKRAMSDGSSGWALSCGSARVVADLLSQRSPAIDIARLGVERLAH